MDEQRVGPYKLWLHTHTLEEVDGGTKMTDEIRYAMPFGPIRPLAHLLFVKVHFGKFLNIVEKN